MAPALRRVVRTMPQIAVVQIDDTPQVKKTKVAAYARVSTEKEEQEDSFERQVEHYTHLIESNPEWTMVEVYKDPGITGTKAEKRPDFLRMIDDCRAGKIDKILVKSVSRFARNTVDALNYIRELRDMNISVQFESENIDTLTPGGEVLLTILAAMAEQESRTMSNNIKWAYQKKFEKGEVTINTGLMLGYTKNGKDEDGRAVYAIVEEEAEIIRRIYREYLNGSTVTQIIHGLEEDGVKTKRGTEKWYHTAVTSILTNEKYTGNAYLGKTYKPDVLSKKRYRNDGEKAPMYYAENSHPAIVTMEMFNMVKLEMERRKTEKEKAVGNTRYTSKYPFSGILICGTCGSRLRRHVRKTGSGKLVPSWGCSNRILNGREVCDSYHVNEDVLYATYHAAVQAMVEDAGSIRTLESAREKELQPRNKAAMDEVEQQIIELQERVLDLHKQYTSTTKTSYTNTSTTIGTTYYYKVKAVKTVDGTNYTSDLSGAKSILCKPAAPTVSIYRKNGKPQLKWSAVTGATKYWIYRSTDGVNFSYYDSTTKTSYTNSGAASGKKYYYRVKAVAVVNGTNATSANSNTKSLMTTLAKPTVSITTSNGKPKITWKAVTGADKYYVYRSTDGKNFSYYDSTTKLSYTNTGAKKNTKYYYKVKAICSANTNANSAYSAVVSIKATK